MSISELSTIAKNVQLGANVVIRQFVNAYGCTIDDNTQVGPFTEIQTGVHIGKNCKIQSHSFLCEGVTIEDEVFIGHGVIFTNDKLPKATNKDGSLQTNEDWQCLKTIVKKGASIGSGATILPGVTIGMNALVGAGSVVTKNVADGITVIGNPAKPHTN